jgi:hypothetical protein
MAIVNGTRSWARDRLDNLIGHQGVERETKTAAIRSSVYLDVSISRSLERQSLERR